MVDDLGKDYKIVFPLCCRRWVSVATYENPHAQ